MPRKRRKAFVDKAIENAEEIEREWFFRSLRQEIRARKTCECQECQATGTALCSPIESYPTDF